MPREFVHRSGAQGPRCPVCGMEVSEPAHAIDYLGMHFRFCSSQCQERFAANPHLYIGRPGEPALAQQGRILLKRRRMHLAQPLTAAQQELLQRALYTMMGVREVEIHSDGTHLGVIYDLMQATAVQIERELARVGAHLGEGWGERLRRAFVHYVEETEVENLEVRPSPGGGHAH